MASYPTLAPNLNNLRLTMTDPTGLESADKLNDSITQTRRFIVDFLGVLVDDTGQLKAAAIGGGTIPAGTIKGSNPVGDVQREILQGSIIAVDIADLAITTAKLYDQSVTTAKLADNSVTAAKIVDGSIGPSELAPQAVTAEKILLASITDLQLHVDCVTTAKIKNLSVTKEKLAARCVDGTLLPECPSGYLLVGGNTIGGVTNCAVPKQIAGAWVLGSDGTLSLGGDIADGTAFAIIAEQTSGGVDSGTLPAVAGNWIVRGAGDAKTPPWTVIADPSQFININGSKIEIKQDGIYRITVNCPAYKVAGHKIRVTVRKDTQSSDTQVWYGSSEISSTTNPTQSRSFCEIVAGFTGATSTIFPYILVEHWVDTLGAPQAGGAGKATGATGAPEVYAIISAYKLA